MKINFPILVQDQQTSNNEQLSSPIEGEVIIRQHFADGPACEEIEILDYDDPKKPKKLTAPTKLKVNKSGTNGHYVDKDGDRLRYIYKLGKPLDTPDFMKVSTMGLVLDTIDLMISEAVVGRKINWAFGKKKLKVHTRGIDQSNAFYDRLREGIYFGFFDKGNKKIYACLSRDIVTHEMGHAIIDAICPQLNSTHPEGLAIHEGLADITAVLSALNNQELKSLALSSHGNLHARLGHFTYIAPEFAQLRDGLRNLENDWHINQKRNDGNFTKDYSNPHELSLVLSGAIMNILEEKQRINKEYILKNDETVKNRRQAGHKSLNDIVFRFTRVVSRSLDWVPPGETNFRTLYKAMIAVVLKDMAEPEHFVKLINKEFLKRGMIEEKYRPDLKELPTKAEVKKLFATKSVSKTKQKLLINLLVDNGFDIGDQTPNFDTELFISNPVHSGKKKRKEGVIKLGRWEKLQLPTAGSRIPQWVFVSSGYTFVFDLNKNKLLFILSNVEETNSERDMLIRSEFINQLIDDKKIKLRKTKKKTPSVIPSEIIDGALRIGNSCSLLHIH